MATTTRKQANETAYDLDDWEQWSAHIAGRKGPLAPWRLIPSRKRQVLRWGLPEQAVPADSERLLSRLEGWLDKSPLRPSGVSEYLESWLAAADGRAGDVAFALECLGWAYLLPKLVGVLSAAPWNEACDGLVKIAGATDGCQMPDPLVEQLLGAELPLTLAYQLPELPACSALAGGGQDRLKNGLKELLDGNGLPRARHVGLVRPLLACWTRCMYLVQGSHSLSVGRKTQLRYEWFVRQALQLTRQNGVPVFSDDASFGADTELFEAALLRIDQRDERAIADQILPGRKATRAVSQRKTYFPESAEHSEWAGVSILRPDWLRGGQQLVLAYDGPTMRSELNCGSQTVWSGQWDTHLTADGTQLEPESDWEEVCWHTDDDVDYLELELRFGGDWRLQRQCIMAREDRFLFLADALVGPAAAEIQYASCLPLAPGVGFQAEQQTHEGTLFGGGPLARVLPLGLPEWRSLSSDGSLESTADKLCQRWDLQTQRLYAALFIDLDRRRLTRPLTWRRLTVAEKLHIVGPAVAVAYRVQAGDQQWLFYRSLDTPGSRTFLGQHLHDEFFAGRLDREGETEELITVNANP
jgi:hypothetical protein